MTQYTGTILSIAVIAVLAVISAPIVLADTITVCWDGTGDYLTIQEGIDAAVNGDEVVICPGTYTGDGNRDLDFSHGLPEGQTRAIIVRSTNPEDPAVVAATVIDCQGSSDNPHRGFTFDSGETANSILAGLTVINGCMPTLKMYQGGAVFCNGSSPTIAHCTFSRNRAIQGGGMGNFNDSNPTLINCTFSSNMADGDGGGVFNYGSRNPTLTNCMFSGNKASRGGGVLNTVSNPTVTNCTFSGNMAEYSGGGMYSIGSHVHGGPMTVMNCILWGNSAPQGPEILLRSTSHPSELTISYSNVQGGQAAVYVDPGCTLNWGDRNIDVDPLFVDPDGPDDIVGTQDDDLHLLSSSPCIDAGDNDALPADTFDLDDDGDLTEPIPFDLDGQLRIIDGDGDGDAMVDMGAYEMQPCILSLLLDILPSDDPNLFVPNKKSKGRIPMVLFATEEVAVENINPESILIAGVLSPIKTSTDKDVNSDGLVDLVMHFSRHSLIDALSLDAYDVGEVIDVTVTAALEGDGCTIVATDNIVIVGRDD